MQRWLHDGAIVDLPCRFEELGSGLHVMATNAAVVVGASLDDEDLTSDSHNSRRISRPKSHQRQQILASR